MSCREIGLLWGAVVHSWCLERYTCMLGVGSPCNLHTLLLQVCSNTSARTAARIGGTLAFGHTHTHSRQRFHSSDLISEISGVYRHHTAQVEFCKDARSRSRPRPCARPAQCLMLLLVRPNVSCSLTFCCAFVLLRRPTARFRSHRNVRAEKHVCWCFVCSRVCACVLLCCVRWCSCFLATRCRPFILWRRPTAHVVVSECARREAAEKHVCWCFVCWRVCMRFVAVFLFACVLFVFGGLCSCLLFACLCCVRCSAFII